MIDLIIEHQKKIVQIGALLNYFDDVLSIDIEGTEYYLTMDVEEEENYIEMT